jgi:dimeric dUTPase (all-alpha-NTP-PPase superfamily)
MDCRDITETVPFIKYKSLEQIFELQNELLSHYRVIEGFPEFPLNLDIKQNQSLIKDFTARIVEELGECFESYIAMKGAVYNENGPNMDSAVNHLQNLNEELSDALHFYMELIMAVSINNEILLDHIISNPQNIRHSAYFRVLEEEKDVLGMGLYLQPEPSAYYGGEGTYVIQEKDLKDEFLRGGRFLGTTGYEMKFKCLLWDTVYNLQLARNALKNKPWKQTQMITDRELFKFYLCETFLSFCALFKYLKMTEESIFTIYFKKNRINLFRIKSKY